MGFKRFWLTLIIVLSLAVPTYSADIRTGGGHVIQDEGTTLNARPYLDFTGDGVSCSNIDATTTECSVGQAAIPDANYYVAGGNADGELINYSSGWASSLDFYPNINTFTNPDFETNVTGWTCNTCGVTPQISTTVYVTGTYSMFFTASGASAIVEDAITVMAETPYTITAWVYDADATNTIDLRIRTDSYTAGSNLCSASTTAAWANGWQRLSCSTPTTNTDTSLYVQVVTNEDATNIYVDDFQLTVQDRTTASNIMQDDGFVTCKNGNCLAVNGANTLVSTADSASLEPTTGLTLSAWVFPTSEKNGNIVEKGATTQYSLQSVSGTYYDDKVQFKFTNNSGGISVTTTGAYNIYEWHHVVAQISGTAGTGADDTVYIYVDNTLVDTFTGQNYQMPTHATGVYIGSSTVLPGGFAGYIDDVRIYSAAISSVDITTMYDSGNGLACTGSETSIVACWEMDETSGATAVSLPAGFNGTLVASTGANNSGWRNCKLGNCVQFDGMDDYVMVKDTPDISVTSALTFSFWLYRGIDTGASETIISKSDADYPSGIRDYDFILDILSTDALRFLITKGIDESYTSIVSTTTISVGQWYHIVVTKDATEFKMYINNSLEGSPTITGTMGNMRDTSMPIMFGRQCNAGSCVYGFQGKIDDFQIYNTALGTTPISTLYNSGTGTACAGTETDLKACWKFDETSGQIAYQVKNQTGLGNDNNDCGSMDTSASSTPCRTIQAVINKIPQYYAGSATVHIASNGLYPENPLVNGYNNSGDFSITFRGYNNPTANQFTDIATLSGASTGSNTANFPKDTLSLFNDTNIGATIVNGTLTNSPTWTASGGVSNQNGYLDFVPGSSQYVTMGNAASLEATSNFTAMAWFKADAADVRVIMGKRQSSGAFAGWTLRVSSDTSILFYTTYSTTNISNTVTVSSLGTGWHHVAYTITNNVGQLYLDGTAVGSTSTGVGTITTTSAIFSIGSLDGASSFWDGGIDEVGIFSTALTQAQIRTYCGWTGSACGGYQIPNNTSGLIHLYHLNNASTGGTTEYDSIEPAFNGNIQPGDLFYIDSGPGSGTWARVQSKQSAIQLALVTRWGITPGSGSTYQVFPNKYLPKIHAKYGTHGFRIRNSSGIALDRIFVTKASYNLSVEFSQINSIARSVFSKSKYIGIDIKDISSGGSILYNLSEHHAGEAFRLFKTSTADSVSYNIFRNSFANLAGYWGSSITSISTNLIDAGNYGGLDWEQNVASYGLAYNRISRNGVSGIAVANGSSLTAIAPNTITSNYQAGIWLSAFAHFNADFYGGLQLSDLEVTNNAVGVLAQYQSFCFAASCDQFTYSGNTVDKKINSSVDIVSANAPTASSCGTGPVVDSSSRTSSGSVLVGSGTVTSCILTFPVTWASAPFCTLTGNYVSETLAATTTTTTLTISSSASMAAHRVRWNCGLQ